VHRALIPAIPAGSRQEGCAPSAERTDMPP
jgi:hypothetical protein